jgi:putative Mg2+ transporter-C (MgtC) family protein
MAWQEILLRLGAAAVIGAVIGLDREIRHKSAGFRTIAIVCVGTALATLIAAGTDPAGASRVIQGAFAGIGFLGAGVIVHHAKDTSVEGLTTAATIWTSAAIGAACGLGYWAAAVIAAVIVICLLAVGGAIERRVRG